MDSVEEECQARKAEDRAQHHINNPNYHYYLYPLLQNIPLALVWNRGRKGKCYITPLYVSANLNEAIADLHRQQQVNQV